MSETIQDIYKTLVEDYRKANNSMLGDAELNVLETLVRLKGQGAKILRDDLSGVTAHDIDLVRSELNL